MPSHGVCRLHRVLRKSPGMIISIMRYSLIFQPVTLPRDSLDGYATFPEDADSDEGGAMSFTGGRRVSIPVTGSQCKRWRRVREISFATPVSFPLPSTIA